MIPIEKTVVKTKVLLVNGFHYVFVACLNISEKFKCPTKKFWIKRTTKSGFIVPSTSFLSINGYSPMNKRAVVLKIGTRYPKV